MWLMGMRLIGQRSPARCGSADADSAPLKPAIPDSQTIRPILSAGDGKREPSGESGLESRLGTVRGGPSPACPGQSRVSPRHAVG